MRRGGPDGDEQPFSRSPGFSPARTRTLSRRSTLFRSLSGPTAANPARYGSWSEGIKFVNLPSGGSINLYALSGARVRSLSISAPQMAWDACNSDGQQVASGLYIWEVVSGSNSQTGKLVIIK